MADENRPTHHGPDNCNNGLSGGQIALIILSCLLIIGIIAALIAWLVQSRNKSKSSSKQNIVQIGETVPQNNIQQTQNATNQKAPNTNQQAAPIMQNNIAQPVAQNNPVSAGTTINQQELIANVVASATPQIMNSMAQFAAQEVEKEKQSEIAVPNTKPETKKEETIQEKTNEDNVQETQTKEEKLTKKRMKYKKKKNQFQMIQIKNLLPKNRLVKLPIEIQQHQYLKMKQNLHFLLTLRIAGKILKD